MRDGFFARLYYYCKPQILAYPSFYENLFHDTAFHKQDSAATMFGINLKMLVILELMYKYRRHFQRLCILSLSGSISDQYGHYDIDIFLKNSPESHFMRISFRNYCIGDRKVSTESISKKLC